MHQGDLESILMRERATVFKIPFMETLADLSLSHHAVTTNDHRLNKPEFFDVLKIAGFCCFIGRVPGPVAS